MRIAVLLTGQLRDSFINYKNHIKCFFEPNNVDVFLVTSNKNFYYTKGNPNPLTFKFSLHSEDSVQNIEKIIKEQYNDYLKDYIIKTDEIIPEGFGTPEYYRYFIRNQFNNNKLAFQLANDYAKKNNFSYDVFVRLRIDKTIFPKPVVITEKSILAILTNIEPAQFFMIANYNQMEHYCKFNYLEGYKHKPGNIFGQGFPHAPDEIYKHMKARCRLNIVNNILKIYQNNDNTICDFPYKNNDDNRIAWNASGSVPQKF